MLLTREEMTFTMKRRSSRSRRIRDTILRALSHLFYGEVGAVKIGQWVTKAPDLEGMLEIVKQTRDETRHTAIFRRLLKRYAAEPSQAVLARHGRSPRRHQSHVGRNAL